MTKPLLKLSISLLLTALTACGGGGGGGGSSTSSSNASGSLKRGTDTAIRVIHADIQAAPVVVKVADQIAQQGRFAEENFYRNINSGPVELRVEQLNGTVFGTVPAELLSKTEYTLLVTLGRSGQPVLTLLTDITERPTSGSSFVRIVHAVKGVGNLTVEVGGVSFGALSGGSASEFLQVPSGEAVMVARSNGGSVVSQKTLTLDDQAETTVLIAGDTALGFVVAREFKDLD